MTIQQWNDSMSVGVERMDDQHKDLLQLLNNAFDASRDHNDTRIIKIIDRLREYTRVHFAEEEILLEGTGYPETIAHREQHNEFTARVEELNRRKYEHVNRMDVFKLLNDWLIKHIMEADKDYGEFVSPPEERI